MPKGWGICHLWHSLFLLAVKLLVLPLSTERMCGFAALLLNARGEGKDGVVLYELCLTKKKSNHQCRLCHLDVGDVFKAKAAG